MRIRVFVPPLALALALGCNGDDSDSGTPPGPDAGNPSEPTICQNDSVSGSSIDPDSRGTVVGTNGAFDDACDENGNLTEYFCETRLECGPGPNPACTSSQTGSVTSQSFDCDGRCENGVCDARCPDFEQAVTYASVGNAGEAVLQNEADGRSYRCDLVFDQPDDSVDCIADPDASTSGTISSLGLFGSFCTGGNFGNIGVAITGSPTSSQHCSYTCFFAY